MVIGAGFHEKQGDKLHNAAGVFYPDGRRVFQRKHLIAAPELAVSSVVPGERKRTCFDVKGFRCALLICADAGMPGIYEELAADRCDAVILITAGAGPVSMGFHQAELSVPERRKKYTELASRLISASSLGTSAWAATGLPNAEIKMHRGRPTVFVQGAPQPGVEWPLPPL